MWDLIEYKGNKAKIKGYFYYKNCSSGKKSALSFVEDFLKGEVNFNDCFGAYIFIIELENGKTICFGDNSGMMRFFINHNSKKIGYTLDEMVKNSKCNLDYRAISQFLYYGCTYDLHTIVSGIKYNDPSKYYCFTDENMIQEKDKKLTKLTNLKSSSKSLENVMSRFCKDHLNADIACTITGGTDSRCVLAHLLHNHLNPHLMITGTKESEDVLIAKKIAQKIGSSITVIEVDKDYSDIKPEMMAELSGVVEPFDKYRLLKKARFLMKNKLSIECGGVAGEMYKNSFINQDFPIYKGKPNWQKFYKYKVAAWNFPKNICGENIKDHIEGIEEYVIKNIANSSKTKQAVYFEAGYFMLQCRFAPISIIQSKYYIPYNPLLERVVAAYPLNENPYRMENQGFQRFQVSKYYPEIKDIETDRGLSLDYKNRSKDSLKSMLFLMKIYISRLLYRNRQADVQKNDGIWKSKKECIEALDVCKNYGILQCDTNYDSIRSIVLDRLFSVGWFIKNHEFFEVCEEKNVTV